MYADISHILSIGLERSKTRSKKINYFNEIMQKKEEGRERERETEREKKQGLGL